MEALRNRLLELGLAPEVAYAVAVLSLLAIAVLVALLVKRLVDHLLKQKGEAARSWQEAIKQSPALSRLAWLVTIIVVRMLGAPLFEAQGDGRELFERIMDFLLVVVGALTMSSVVTAVIDYLGRDESGERRMPVKVVDQSLQVIIWAYASVTLLSILTGKDLASVLAGMTAIGAVLVYVFRDMILGWTAGVQLAANDLVHEGDWISIPTHDADGVVEEIALTTVRIRNWDNTISSVPTYGLFSEGFRNWRGMLESGTRRFTRSLAIDGESVRFCDRALLEQLRQSPAFERLSLLPDEARLEGDPLDGLCETNLSLFRRWLVGWLREHPKISENATTMVRERPSRERGIPVEIYAFSKEQSVVPYERLQADLMDQIHAILPRFGLRLFQVPSGNSFQRGAVD